MEIVKIEMNLKAVNKSIAVFNCENLDGGHVLGKFDSPHCAVKAISLLTVKVSDGEQAGFGNYRSYKRESSEIIYQPLQ